MHNATQKKNELECVPAQGATEKGRNLIQFSDASSYFAWSRELRCKSLNYLWFKMYKMNCLWFLVNCPLVWIPDSVFSLCCVHLSMGDARGIRFGGTSVMINCSFHQQHLMWSIYWFCSPWVRGDTYWLDLIYSKDGNQMFTRHLSSKPSLLSSLQCARTGQKLWHRQQQIIKSLVFVLDSGRLLFSFFFLASNAWICVMELVKCILWKLW